MYSISSIAEITGGRFIHFENDAEIEYLAYDSRNISFAATSLFFALQSPGQDGHRFLQAAYKKGVRSFMVHKEVDTALVPGSNILLVQDTLTAMQRLASWHRGRFQLPVAGITGSNGKTIVKEWLYQLLHEKYRIVRSPRSFNSQLGVPLSVWQLTEGHDLALFEAGISAPGEMGKLQQIIRPSMGIFTSLGDAHGENFVSKQAKLAEKMKLFEGAAVVIGEERIIGKGPGHFTWGDAGADLVITSVVRQPASTTIHARLADREDEITIPFTDDASVMNAITCWCVLEYLGMDPLATRAGFRELQPVDMRLQLKAAVNGCLLINDSYSADRDSLRVALDFLQQQSAGRGRTVVISEFAQDQKYDHTLYHAIADQLLSFGITRVIAVGERIHEVLRKRLEPPVKYHFYYSTDDLIRDFRSSLFSNEVILLKGARHFQFERIAALFEQKRHQTVLEIDLNAIAHNLKEYQRLLRPGTRVMAMVKAFSYGSGGAEIASVLQYHNADFLGVAYADEGAELVKAGISLPVMVMNVEDATFQVIIDYNLQPVIYSLELLRSFSDYLSRQGIASWPVHLEVDTGMNRLGFHEGDIEIMAQAMASSPLVVQSVFSHLAASEEESQDEFTRLQAVKFAQAADIISSYLGYPFLRHISNSAAIVRHPEMQLDMVRPGIGLYGIETSGSGVPDLRPVATLRTTIAQLRRVKKGETVSYNRHGLVERDSCIATVRIGYADGYSRNLGNGMGKMLVHGRLAPVIGAICMDMTMLDITDIPGVKPGDDVIVFGAGLPVQQLAGWMGTIPYEVMTGISQRVKRVYFHE